MEEEKLNAVRNYLSAEFPDYTIDDLHDFDRIAQTFRLTTKDKIHLVTISREFLDDHSPFEITEILERSSFSKYFQLGDIARIIVTNTGILVE